MLLAFDPATFSYGWSLIRDNQIVDLGVWELKGKTIVERARSFWDQWRLFYADYSPYITMGAIEGQFVGKNELSAIEVCYAAGWGQLALCGLPQIALAPARRIGIYLPTVWRKSFGMQSHGREEAKIASINTVRNLLGDVHYNYGGTKLHDIPETVVDNATEAALIGLHAYPLLKRNWEITPTATRRSKKK